MKRERITNTFMMVSNNNNNKNCRHDPYKQYFMTFALAMPAKLNETILREYTALN